jgi:very-short-patch-repair endonuclease
MDFRGWRSPGKLWGSLKPRARELRRRHTEAEAALWKRIRNRRLLGYKFRRQHVLGGHIVDFYCREALLIIEVDGAIHDRQREADALREQYLELQGVRILRLRNEVILAHPDDAISQIAEMLQANRCRP